MYRRIYLPGQQRGNGTACSGGEATRGSVCLTVGVQPTPRRLQRQPAVGIVVDYSDESIE